MVDVGIWVAVVKGDGDATLSAVDIGSSECKRVSLNDLNP